MAIGALLTAFLVSLCVQPPMIKLLELRRVLDHPSERSSHVTPTPRGGGIAVVIGVVIALAFVVDAPWPALACIGALALLGLIEDFWGVPILIRLACQVIIGMTCGVLLTAEFGTADVGLGVLIGAWLVFFVNAFNFMDGINGISALQTIAVGLVLGLAGALAAGPLVTGWALALVGAATGFLPFNIIRARVFLGDVGSYGVGAAIALLTVQAVQSGVPVWVAGAVHVVYAVDVIVTVLRRIKREHSLLIAHRTHIYQQLISTGWSHVAVACSVAALSVIIGLCSVVAWRSQSSAVTVIAGFVALSLLVAYLIAPRASRSPGFWSAADSL